MTIDEAYRAYIEAQGRYASELQRFRDSARPDMMRLAEAGQAEMRARKIWMTIKRDADA